MSLRKIALAAVTIATLSPTVSKASPETISAKACATAFASSIAAPGAGTTPAYKLAYRGMPDTVWTNFYPSEFSFTLEARDPKTSLPTARAVCSTDYRGNVRTISAVTLYAATEK